mmetsp:Transcript_21026/g.34469  ORF Transcript_21026/g.34469 Transcript_21026/m.34469 type:complete len:210 (-) Transcript_21026:486-1115(-)
MKAGQPSFCSNPFLHYPLHQGNVLPPSSREDFRPRIQQSEPSKPRLMHVIQVVHPTWKSIGHCSHTVHTLQDGPHYHGHRVPHQILQRVHTLHGFHPIRHLHKRNGSFHIPLDREHHYLCSLPIESTARLQHDTNNYHQLQPLPPPIHVGIVATFATLPSPSDDGMDPPWHFLLLYVAHDLFPVDVQHSSSLIFLQGPFHVSLLEFVLL